jgi:hypothetical protein
MGNIDERYGYVDIRRVPEYTADSGVFFDPMG